LKKEAIAKLESGGLFAFGVSEKAHGADLFANEFMVTPSAAGEWVANGGKYYIGNSNAACIITILGKKGSSATADATKRAPFIFFALRPAHAPAFQNLKKIRTLGIRPAFVGEFEVVGHPFPTEDIVSEGREAWDSVFATVNFGKYFLGFGAVGICERAFAEAIVHMRNRTLYGKPITEMPHIRATAAVAFARLTAMKLYAYRALDYLQVSSKDDRRYLLFNAVQKAKVSTEGVKVMALLSECIGAHGVESDTYFELALRDAQLIPGLEGSTHINFGLTAQFIANYFAAAGAELPYPDSVFLRESDPDENPYWWQGRDRIAKTVNFAHFLKSFAPLKEVPNVRSFTKQVKAFSLLAAHGISILNPDVDAGLFIAIGKCFSTIAYAQLVAENCLTARATPALVSVIFHGMIEDLAADSLKLSAMFRPGSTERALFRRMVRVPKTIIEDLESVHELIAKRYQIQSDGMKNS
jgi:acyl-CoA dehydrogenase